MRDKNLLVYLNRREIEFVIKQQLKDNMLLIFYHVLEDASRMDALAIRDADIHSY